MVQSTEHRPSKLRRFLPSFRHESCPLVWVFLSVVLWSFLRRQRWTCCPSLLMSHPILMITIIFILHPLSRASTATLSVPLSPLLSSHPYLPSSMTTWGATTCPLRPPKTPKRRTSLNARDRPATEGLCEFLFCLLKNSCDEYWWKEAPLNDSFMVYFLYIK